MVLTNLPKVQIADGSGGWIYADDLTPTPTQPGDCATFDWTGNCATNDLFPTNGTLSVGTATVYVTPQVSWLPDGWWEVKIPAGTIYKGAVFGSVAINEIWIGTSGPHPDPWYIFPIDLRRDYCIGYGLQAGYEGSSPSTANISYRNAQDSSTPWIDTNGGVFLSSAAPGAESAPPGFYWTKSTGWADDDAWWSDGAPAPGQYTGGVSDGCRVVGDYEWKNISPYSTRRSTASGRWQFDISMFHLTATQYLFSEIRWNNDFVIRGRQRWSRATLPPA